MILRESHLQRLSGSSGRCHGALRTLSLKILQKGAALLNPALQSEGQGLPNWEVKSGERPRVNRARGNCVKIEEEK